MGPYNTSKLISVFFLRVLPQLLRSIFLAACILWKRYGQLRKEQEYVFMIERQTSRFSYKKPAAEDGDGGGEHCGACLLPLVDGDDVRELRGCGHRFHGLCLQRWLQAYYKSSCPLCRSKVLPEEAVREYRRTKAEEEEDGVMSGVEKELALILLGASSHCGGCNGLFV